MRFALWALVLCATVAAAPEPLHVRGTAAGVVDGRPVDVSVEREGGRELVRVCGAADVCAGTWFDGVRRWQFGINGVLVPDDAPPAGGPLIARARAAAVAVAQPLSPPAGPSVTFHGNDAVHLSDDPVPVVACTIARRAARCLLDSGTTPSLMTLPEAEALGLDPRGAMDIVGFATVTTGIVTTGPLDVGPAHLDRVSFAVVPRSQAVGFDVVVGADLLGRVQLVFDRAHRTARLVAPGSVAPAHPIPLQFRSGVPAATYDLGGRPGEALVDTGDSAIISEGYAAYREGPQWPVVGRTVAAGFGGTDDVLEVAVPDAAIGPLQLGAVHALIRRTQREAHVGVGPWDRCLLTLDESNSRMGC